MGYDKAGEVGGCMNELPYNVGAFLDMIHREIDDPDKIYEIEVQACFLEAIRKYQKSNLWFLEKSSDVIDAKCGQQIYRNVDSPFIGNSGQIFSVQIFDEVQRMFMELDYMRFDPDIVENRKEKGQPIGYMLFGEKMYLVPAPNKDYLIKIWAEGSYIPDPTKRSETSIWIDEAYILIKEATKALIYMNILKDNESAAMAKTIEREAYDQLVQENSRRKNHDQIQVTYF